MAGLRIECTLAEIDEIERRLRHVFHTNDRSKEYKTQFKTSSDPTPLFYFYHRIYMYEKDTLLDQLLAAQKYANDLVIEREELLAQIAQLKQQLGELPQPKPYDAVLGGKRGHNL